MPITAAEHRESRKYVGSEDGLEFIRIFTVFGTSEPNTAAEAPCIPAYGEQWGASNLYVSRKEGDPIHADTMDEIGSKCRVTVIYRDAEHRTESMDDEEDTFEVGTTQEHIVKALSQVNDPVAANYGLAINWNGVEVQGIDAFFAATTSVVTKQRNSLSGAYKRKVVDCLAKTNSVAFSDFNIEEVLFAGMQARRRGSGKWLCRYTFMISPKVTVGVELFDGTLISVDKEGWRYLWYTMVRGLTDAGDKLRMAPESVHVAKIYATRDFAAELEL